LIECKSNGAGKASIKVSVPLMKGCVPFVLAALLMAPAAIACDAALEAAVAAKSEDTDARDALARSCARAGEPAKALVQYDILLAQNATNPDWLLGKSQALVEYRYVVDRYPTSQAARIARERLNP